MSNLDLELTGQTTHHLSWIKDLGIYFHKNGIQDLLELKHAAQQCNFDLRIASGFRSYQRQLEIWNSKALGQNPILDINGQPIIYHDLSPKEIIFTILRWSALPGCSRHHWGTDVDVYDLSALPDPNYEIKLIPEEVSPEGLFGPFHQWLDQKISKDNTFPFYRPYEIDSGGVAPEKWHLSHKSLAQNYQKKFTFKFFVNTIENSNIALKETVLQNGKEIYENYIFNDTE